ncbi:MAG: sigma-70 family RNA polymerase sigma factor [Firmicutes bacterium]|nr:sigma-70 family RNA polymerase sigma factor [Bacillota bacterium]
MEKEKLIELYDEFFPDVQRLAFSFLKNKEDSMDAAQDVFVKLMRSNIVLIPGKEKMWLLKVTANECRDMLRRSRPTEELPEDMTSQETDREVWELLSGLKPEDRAVIQLYYFDGYSVKEIGQILGITASGVSMRLSRARKKLRAILEDEYE